MDEAEIQRGGLKPCSHSISGWSARCTVYRWRERLLMNTLLSETRRGDKFTASTNIARSGPVEHLLCTPTSRCLRFGNGKLVNVWMGTCDVAGDPKRPPRTGRVFGRLNKVEPARLSRGSCLQVGKERCKMSMWQKFNWTKAATWLWNGVLLADGDRQSWSTLPTTSSHIVISLVTAIASDGWRWLQRVRM